MYVTALVVTMTACSEDPDLTKLCPQKCYTGPEDTEDVGACKAGIPTCNENGDIVTCNDTAPTTEICNAIDDDCDGIVDEFLKLSPFYDENTCLKRGKCWGTYEVCDSETGQWFCDYKNGPPTEETCNGVDDDCDGQIDEDVYPSGGVVFCYDGPPATAVKGICRPGIEICEKGAAVCDGQVLPREEHCNGEDDDCNGLVDDVDYIYDAVDIVLGIDTSGSMEPIHAAVTSVICDYASAMEASDDNIVYQFGLVLIATPDYGFSLYQDLTDAATMCEALTYIEVEGATEPTLSAALAVVDPDNPLGISWRDGSKRVFIGFGDEEAATTCILNYADPTANQECVNDTLTASAEACLESDTDVYWFVENPILYDEQAHACGGRTFYLSPYEEYMLNDLNSIISEICLDDGPESLDAGVQ